MKFAQLAAWAGAGTLAAAAAMLDTVAFGQTAATAGNVTEARVLAEASQGINWPVNGGSFGSPHYSPLKQINDKNVSQLKLAWYLDIDSPMGLATEPIVVDGTIYATASLDRVSAIDAASGRVLWTFDPHVQLSRLRNSAAARTNRGVAVWEGKVFVGTGDCRMIALDAASGRQLWASPVCVDSRQTGITGAPRVGDGKVFIGYNGSDTGVRGSVVAFDAHTGKLLWRFWNVPGDPSKGFENKALEMAAKTWSGDHWWEVGGGDVWDPITYDPATKLLIYGTAGATPDIFFGDRYDWDSIHLGGNRLFAGCIVAVHADTGEYAWHYQTSIHTENFHVLVTDLKLGGVKRHVVMSVPRNGTFYVLDARTGKLISQKSLATSHSSSVNQVDDRALAQVAAGGSGSDASATREQRTATGHNWWPMSYNPITGLVYIPTYDDVAHPRGYLNESIGRLIAWDPVTQSARWSVEEPLPTNSGVLSTAGNLVFAGQGTGELDAYSADRGHKLWSLQTLSAVDAVPVSYQVGADQYILFPVGLGSHSRNFGPISIMATPESKRGPSRLYAFKLGGQMAFPTPHIVVPPVPRPPDETASSQQIHQGEELFTRFNCNDCHSPDADGAGAWVVNGTIPDLRYMPADVHDQFLAIVMGGTHRENGMPGFADEGFAKGDDWPITKKAMTADEAQALHAYVIHQEWKAYKDDQARVNSRAPGSAGQP